MKILIFDAGSIITLSMNGLTYILKDLKKIFAGKFVITKEVKYEIIDRPINIKRFKLEALQIKKLFDSRTLVLPESIGIKSSEIKKKAEQLRRKINSTFYAKGKPIKILQRGELSCLALSLIAEDKLIKNAIVVDERTTRMLAEKPENLRKLFEKKLHTDIKMKNAFPELKNIIFLRSPELVYLAYKRKLIKLKDGKDILDALLYATKFKGASISREEIENIKKLE